MSHVLSEEELEERNVQQFRIRKMVKSLEKARGNGTSMISLIIPPGEQIARYSKMLTEEYGTASNIKNRVNRLSVLEAITSTQQKLKLYNKVPQTGLVIYCGTVLTDENKEKKLNLAVVPHKPINTSLYLCDNKFHTECLNELMESDEKYGFVIMDGSGSLFGLLSGNSRTILNKMTVDLPKKHGRGGQSAVRFSRLRTEKRHNYVRKVAEMCVQFFITNDKPNVNGLILAGLADFKNELATSDMFDVRLKRIVLKIVDVSYGSENGFNQAIEASQETLKNVHFIHEKKILTSFFDEIAQDTGKYCFGIRDTFHALEAGSVETLLIYEDLDIYRCELKNEDGENKIAYMTIEQEQKEMENSEWKPDREKVLLIEWFAEHYKDFGCHLEFITDKTEEGAQFLKGFGGLGGILRYQIEFNHLDNIDDFLDLAEKNSDEEYDYDFDF